jgi:hypothetical protein
VINRNIRYFMLAAVFFVASCSGGGGGKPPPPPPPRLGSDASLSSISINGVALNPAFSPEVTSYNASVPFAGNVVVVTATTNDANASLRINGGTDTAVSMAIGDNTISIVATAENRTTTRTYTVDISRSQLAHEAYVKASNTDAMQIGGSGDGFGISVGLSTDGRTMAIGAWGEDSAAVGVNGDQTDNSALRSGAVYVFDGDGLGGWSQQAYIKASNTGVGDHFGEELALSGDGNTLVVGTWDEDSGATGIDGDGSDNSADGAGAVYVFARDGANTWVQQAYLKASNTDADDAFGRSVAISADGNLLVVAAHQEASGATEIDGDQADNTRPWAGAVYAYTRDETGIWSQTAYMKPSFSDMGYQFGWDIALSGDGSTLAVGVLDSSGATGINGDQTDQSATLAGAVRIFVQDGGGTWSEQAYLKASNTDEGDFFGSGLALAADGGLLAVGAILEDSTATGVNGDQSSDIGGSNSGAAYVFARGTNGVWVQQAYLKASNTHPIDEFGQSVAMSVDGRVLAISAPDENGRATGVNGDQRDIRPSGGAGAVYVFTRDSRNGWQQEAYVKATNTGDIDKFGIAVAVSGDGHFLAVGGYNEGSSATGINGDQLDDNSEGAGAVYVLQ